MRPQGDCTCPSCGGLYWRKSARWHKCAINTASNVAINEVADAINTGAVAQPPTGSVAEGNRPARPEGVDQVSARTPNRRSRADYNEYMRNKMREYRLKKKGVVWQPSG